MLDFYFRVAKRVCYRLEIGFNNLSVKSDERKKGTSSAASFFNFGGGVEGGSGVCFPFFFKILATKYVLIWRLFPTKTHP